MGKTIADKVADKIEAEKITSILSSLEETELSTIPEGPPIGGPDTVIYGVPSPRDTMKYSKDDAVFYGVRPNRTLIKENAGWFVERNKSEIQRDLERRYPEMRNLIEGEDYIIDYSMSVVHFRDHNEDGSFKSRMRDVGKKISQMKHGDSFATTDDIYGRNGISISGNQHPYPHRSIKIDSGPKYTEKDNHWIDRHLKDLKPSDFSEIPDSSDLGGYALIIILISLIIIFGIFIGQMEMFK